ncbi:hypothetical protein [Mucilaginibacter jinjuensis]|uniref:Uncharacterized protein n=1 Tax=Mucilaginibacter jinjuensis TaxID=1176721 RepID=A0ABY7T8N8_9SPHI|nr:hypothetical protein [Mucilaginibacter jinjuensis]WCT11587.1 hypothetical protein PQO05_22870 [Mucilaginibacter jinjuensis]
MAIKKAWHTPEVIIIATNNVNGGGPNPTFHEGASQHITKVNAPHSVIAVSPATFNSYVS